MIALGWDNNTMAGDLSFDAGFRRDDGLGTAVFISLFTDRRAAADDGLPPAGRRGWVGDALADVEGDRIGSRLWLLRRAKQTEETRQRAEAYVREALDWMIGDGLATAIEVEAAWVAPGMLGCRIAFTGGSDVAPIVARLRVGG